jgi:ATP-dependent transcriptional regulator
MPEIILTKLLPPHAHDGIIERPRLIRLLSQNGGRKLILLTAPAGYGKTVLAFQYARTLSKPFLWYQLDDYDNDPAVFIQYIIQGLHSICPDLEKEGLLESVGSVNIKQRIRLLVTLIVNGLVEKAAGGLSIVLDDYHVIHEPIIHQLLQELLEYIPPAVQIIIASRITLPFNINRQKAAGEVYVADYGVLRFSTQEIGDFFLQSHHQVSEPTISIIETKTAGWPALLRLFSETAPGIIDTLPRFETGTIYEYLASEVLERQSEEVRRFLLATSVFETFTAEKCDLLLKRNDSRLMLEYLIQKQLFLNPLTGEGKNYRYHQLFREFLLARLEPGQKKLLFRQAGEIARQMGDLDSAAEYLIISGMDNEVVSLISSAARQAFQRGRWKTVNRWLSLVPGEYIEKYPWLSFSQATCEIYRGRLDSAEYWIQKAIINFSHEADSRGLAECRLLQSRILRGRGRYQESIKLLDEAYPHLMAEGKPRFDLPLERFFTLLVLGEFSQAEAILIEAQTKAEQENDRYLLTHILEAFGHAYYLFGDLPKSLHFYQRALQVSPDRILPNYYFQDFIPLIYLLWGDTDQALEHARQSVSYKEKLGLTEALPSAYYQLARTYADRGELQAAEKYYNLAIDYVIANGSEYLFFTLNKISLALCLALQSRFIEAKALAEKVLAEAQEQSVLLLGLCQNMTGVIFAFSGDLDKAAAILEGAHVNLGKMGYQQLLAWNWMNLAGIKFLKRENDAPEYAKKALEIAAKNNYIQDIICCYNLVYPILQYGLENGIAVDFIQQILIRLGTRALNILNDLALHPDPEIRRRVILPLHQISSPQAKIKLRLLLRDPDPEIREFTKQIIKNETPHIDTAVSAAPESFYATELATKGGILSKREAEVAALLCQRLSMFEIATKLALSPRTIQTYLENIKKKLGVRTKRELILKLIGEEESKNIS